MHVSKRRKTGKPVSMWMTSTGFLWRRTRVCPLLSRSGFQCKAVPAFWDRVPGSQHVAQILSNEMEMERCVILRRIYTRLKVGPSS